jgi:hypothetical protein
MNQELEKELKEVRELMVDLEKPTTRNLMEPETIDTIRKALTQRFKGLLVAKAKKVDKDSMVNIESCLTQDRPQLIMTLSKVNPSSSPAQEEQESPS